MTMSSAPAYRPGTTPGAWQVWPTLGDSYNVCAFHEGDELVVAQVSNRADADLIAAAPRSAETVEMIRLLVAAGSDYFDGEYMNDAVCSALDAFESIAEVLARQGYSPAEVERGADGWPVQKGADDDE